jgi:hypothetical protein
MIPKKPAQDVIGGGARFSDKIMLKPKETMIPKSGNRLSDQIMLTSEPMWLVMRIVRTGVEG